MRLFRTAARGLDIGFPTQYAAAAIGTGSRALGSHVLIEARPWARRCNRRDWSSNRFNAPSASSRPSFAVVIALFSTSMVWS
jgi:hypothetical protein